MRHLDKKWHQISTIQNLQEKVGIGESAIDDKFFHLRFSKNKKLFLDPSLEYRMVLCEPSQEFWKGLDSLDRPNLNQLMRERPVDVPAFKTRVTKPFLVLEHAVTQELWKRVVNMAQEDPRLKEKEPYKYVNPSPSGYLGLKKPIHNKSWNDCILFCNMLSILQGLQPCYQIKSFQIGELDKKRYVLKMLVDWDRSANGYRLPTDVEKYYLIQASFDSNFNDYFDRRRNNIQLGDYVVGTERTENGVGRNPEYMAKLAAIQSAKLDYKERRQMETKLLKEFTGPAEVKSKKPNNWGLYDLVGNVNEFCYDDLGKKSGLYFAEQQASNNNSTQADVAFEVSKLTKSQIVEYSWGYNKGDYESNNNNIRAQIDRMPNPNIGNEKICRGFSYRGAIHHEEYSSNAQMMNQDKSMGYAEMMYSQSDDIGFRFVRNL